MRNRTRRQVLLKADLRPVPNNPEFSAVFFYVDRMEELGVILPHSMIFLSRN